MLTDTSLSCKVKIDTPSLVIFFTFDKISNKVVMDFKQAQI